MGPVRDDRQRFGEQGRVFPNMKVFPLLFFWSVALVHAGELGKSLDYGDARSSATSVNSAVIRQARDHCASRDPSSTSPCGSLWDEEEDDSLTDVFLDTGLRLSGSSLIRERDGLSSFGRRQHDLHRSPSRSNPLRC
jgi:hypothetical protein